MKPPSESEVEALRVMYEVATQTIRALLHRLAHEVAAAVEQEREACAQAVEALLTSGENVDAWTITRDVAFARCAEAIRARGQRTL